MREEAAPGAARRRRAARRAARRWSWRARRADWETGFDELVAAGRAARVATRGGRALVRRRAARRASRRSSRRRASSPTCSCPAALAARGPAEPDAAAAAAVRGHLEGSGPLTRPALAARPGCPPAQVELALARLEAEGFALRGRFDAESRPTSEEWCERRLLARIHRYTHERLRREIEPVTAQDFMRFLLRWQHVAPGTQREGRRGALLA